jgi:hypothetical protein
MKKIIDSINEFHETIKEWFKNTEIVNLKEKHVNNKVNNMEGANNNSDVSSKQDAKSRNKKKS